MGMFDIPVPSKTDTNVPVPKTPEITVDTYNKNLSELKKSFKEAAELVESLYMGKKEEEISEATMEEYQENYTNSIMFESYCDGPIFEKVNDENKEEIRAIAKKIRSKINKGHVNIVDYFKGKTQVSNKPSNFIGILVDTWVIDPAIISTFNNSELKLKSWQTISYLVPSREDSIKNVLAKMNQEFKEDLGDKYEIDVIKLRLIGSVFTKKKELTDDEKERSGDFKDLFFRPLLLIVKNKGTSASNKTPEMQIELSKESAGKLTKMKDKIVGLVSKVKNKVTGNKVENKNESTEVKDDKEDKKKEKEKEDKKEDKKKKDEKDSVKTESVDFDDDFDIDEVVNESTDQDTSEDDDIEID